MVDNVALEAGQVLQFLFLAGLLYLMWRWGGCCGMPVRPPQPRPQRPSDATEQDALRELQLRLARGEIDVEEYERIRALLNR